MSRVVIVNDRNEVIGSEEFKTALEKNLIRRVARVFVINKEGKIFLQRRNDNAPLFPDTWDVSAGGHVDPGESYLEAAKRELFEEIGVKDVNLKKVARFFTEEKYKEYDMKSFDELYEAPYDGELDLDPHELKGGAWFSLGEIEKMVKEDPSEIATGCIISIEKYKKAK